MINMLIDTPFGEFCTNDLIWAAYKNDILDVENYILEEQININDTDDSGYTALNYAVEAKNVEMIKLLIAAGAKSPVHNI